MRHEMPDALTHDGASRFFIRLIELSAPSLEKRPYQTDLEKLHEH